MKLRFGYLVELNYFTDDAVIVLELINLDGTIVQSHWYFYKRKEPLNHEMIISCSNLRIYYSGP